MLKYFSIDSFSPSNLSQIQLPCSGRGECVCGECEICDCLPGSVDKNTCRRFTGLYCQCNPDNCPRNSKGICSGQLVFVLLFQLQQMSNDKL